MKPLLATLVPPLVWSLLIQVPSAQLFGPQQIISTAGDEPQSVFAADVDGDGDLDAFSADAGSTIAWHENLAGDGSSWSTHVISTSAPGAFSVFFADVDGDGDLDALSASGSDDKIAWYQNISGPCLTGPAPGIVGPVNTITLSNATPGGLVGVGFSLTLGSTPVGAFCPGLTMDLANPTVVGIMPADASGNASFSGFVPASLRRLRRLLNDEGMNSSP